MKEVLFVTIDAVCNYLLIVLSLIMILTTSLFLYHVAERTFINLSEILFFLSAPLASLSFAVIFEWGLILAIIPVVSGVIYALWLNDLLMQHTQQIATQKVRQEIE